MKTDAYVLHVDIDAFFASVEQLRNPRLAGRPVAVGAGVIASCSYEARRFGLSAGMPLGEARKRCPNLAILEGHYPIYRSFAEHVFDICRKYAPAVESHLDEAFCDLSGTERLYGFAGERRDAPPSHEPPWVAREIQERIRDEVGLSASLGIARNRMLAKMASKRSKPGGLLRIEPAEEDGFLRLLPVRLLPGVGPTTASVLAKLNIATIEEMRVLSRSSLKAMFGQNGILLYERCRGEDTRIIGAREIPRSISRETSFHHVTTDPEEIEGMLHYLAERAANTLRKLGLKTRTVEVKLRYWDFQDAVGARTLKAPTQLDGEIFEAALGLRRSLHTRRVALRLVGVTLSRLQPDDGTRPVELWDFPSASSQEGARAVPHSAFPPSIPPRGDAPRGREAEGEDPLETVVRACRERRRALSLCRSLDGIRERFGYSAVVSGKSLHLLGKLPQDAYGYILRTPSLTR